MHGSHFPFFARLLAADRGATLVEKRRGLLDIIFYSVNSDKISGRGKFLHNWWHTTEVFLKIWMA